MPKVSRLEQETIILFNQEEDSASLYTASPAIYRRMTKKGFKAENLDSGSWRFEIPRKAVRLPSKRPNLSAKQKQVASERMKGLRKVKL